MHRLVTLAAISLIAASAAAGCGDASASMSTRAGSYPGDVRSKRCASHWFVGRDRTASFSCTPEGYRLEFIESGQETSRTAVATAATMRVDAIVQTSSPAGTHLIADPGVGCYVDADHGWLAQLGSASVFVLIAVGSSTPLIRGTSTAVRRLSKRNHLVFTCDASGSRTMLSLRINGRLVAHDVVAGKAVRLNRFGVWAAAERRAVVEVRSIVATTSS